MSLLTLPPKMSQVNPSTFAWFVSKLKGAKKMSFANGTGYYQNDTLVAAALDQGWFIKK